MQMPGHDVLSHIVNRAISDPKFRELLAQNPPAALEPLGIKLTDAQLAAIKSMNNTEFKKHLEALGKAFGIDPVAFN